MSASEGENIEQELVVVGRQLAFLNHKLQSQFENMKDLMQEYEDSLGEEGIFDILGGPSALGPQGIEPVGTPLPAPPMLTTCPSPVSIVLPDLNMTDLLAAILPLVQYDMFSWREDTFPSKLGKRPRSGCTGISPPCTRMGFLHVPVAVLGGKEVDMPYGLWEDLHRQIVRSDNAQFLKNNHPMLHVFYKSMEAQLCGVTRCRPELRRKTPPVPKFLG
jgi:hypothetical protein